MLTSTTAKFLDFSQINLSENSNSALLQQLVRLIGLSPRVPRLIFSEDQWNGSAYKFLCDLRRVDDWDDTSGRALSSAIYLIKENQLLDTPYQLKRNDRNGFSLKYHTDSPHCDEFPHPVNPTSYSYTIATAKDVFRLSLLLNMEDRGGAREPRELTLHIADQAALDSIIKAFKFLVSEPQKFNQRIKMKGQPNVSIINKENLDTSELMSLFNRVLVLKS